MSTTDGRPEYCKVSSEECANSRRCFMTGEHCSKQMNVYQERKKQHTKQTRTLKEGSDEVEYKDSYEINAFVVMNFSDMSNVVYKWHLRSFIESLAKYLYINTETHEVICVADHAMPFPTNELPKGMAMDDPENPWKQVDQINVIRSDSNPGSNYVICNRVCQQMQIADLVIVDVSVENTNVFYELGMAMAFGKLILPICYNESIFEHVLPVIKNADGKIETNYAIKSIQMRNAHYKKTAFKWENDNDPEFVALEKHIDCFPWRRRLFEHYGIRFKSQYSTVQYGPYHEAKDGSHKGMSSEAYGFTDLHYSRFPYDQEIDHLSENGYPSKKIGEQIYHRLRKSYNTATPDDNTLVVYTMDGFMNEDEAGKCIVNFYTYMTAQMKHLQCFQGDRVGILVQENIIKEDIKDAKARKDLMYNIGNIIHIGMNQATYAAQKERIKTRDFLSDKDTDASGQTQGTNNVQDTGESKQQCTFVKSHVGNRSITILPDRPIYVEHVKDGIQKNVLNNPRKRLGHGFTEDEVANVVRWDTLYKRYYCLYHIMLRTLAYTHEIVVDISNNSIQALFWLGAAHGSDANAITVRYQRSEKEQAEEILKFGRPERPIFDVSGLWTAILRSHDTEGFYRELMQAQLSIEQHNKLVLEELDVFSEKILDYLHDASYRDQSSNDVSILVDNKKDKEARKLESYYRDYFWRRMLRYNKLHMYLAEYPEQTGPDLVTPLEKRDVKTVAEFSHYLSKRKVIGEYYIETLNETKTRDKAGEIENQNFVSIGGKVKLFHGQNLLEYRRANSESVPKKPSKKETDAGAGPGGTTKYARLFFWREVPDSHQQSVKFQVALIGENAAATRALSSVLVDREQKIAMFGVKWDRQRKTEKLFLNELQLKIRSTFTDRFIKKYREDYGGKNKQEMENYIRLYLSTVLYRYFMPFLTWEDEHRICNGLEAFLIALRRTQKGKMSAQEIKEFEDKTRSCLTAILGEFRGVEVEYTATPGENGKIKDIMLNDNGVTCLFVEK